MNILIFKSLCAFTLPRLNRIRAVSRKNAIIYEYQYIFELTGVRFYCFSAVEI